MAISDSLRRPVGDRTIGSAPLRVGVIGAGAIARAHAVAFIARPDLLRLAAVSDPRPAAAAALAELCPGAAKVSTDYRFWIGDGDVDAVLIAAPHDLHFSIAADCLREGLHTLVEKPLCLNLAEARSLRRLAMQHGVQLSVARVRRHHKTVRAASRWMRTDPANFGALVSFDLHACQAVDAYLSESGAGSDHWILDGQQAGGGILISVAIHYLDLLRYLTGEDYETVYAAGKFDTPLKNGAESVLCATFRMTNGAIGTLHATYWAKRLPYNDRLNIYGTRGSLIQHLEPIGAHRGRFFGAVAAEPIRKWDDQYKGFEEINVTDKDGPSDDPFVNQLHDFAGSILGNRPAMSSIDENFNTLACVEAAYASLRSGCVEQVATE